MKPEPVERVLRVLYSLALYALAPVTIYHLIWRGFRQPAYFQRWGERYGRYGDAPPAPAPLWVHAVSVGEVAAAAPLVNALLEKYPGRRLVMTCITPTGSERIRALWGDRVAHVYLPYDLPGAVGRFLDHFRPETALIMETELWPNLLFGCRDRGVPAHIVNARLSARSLRGYQVLAPLVSRALATVRRVCAQSGADAARFIALGARPETVVEAGNLKFDVAVREDAGVFIENFRARAGRRMAWIAASTHPDEELVALNIHRRLRRRWPDLLMLWAPRHPERFRAVVELARSGGLRVATRQGERWPDGEDAVFVIDTLGELPVFFEVAEVAFVGGSLQPIGGHNLLEPAAVGVPVVTGPHLHNFAEIADSLKRIGALAVAEDESGLETALAGWLADADARRRVGAAERELVEAGRGALAKTLRALGL
ncbi:3-deoxy-D-manno-octulosonic acid transferase [Lysobacter pythonis]|uniref:3-deoxy-D-manno-octulosonic acid transferase n=1 Tax=Solilutibacter pythonis TaxID=2483112 RepID=A0A3M2HTQ5_9GAMM|nr:lipid IV(A) 3-deoxy-D-manno-octulosonic acid transferase [Lysobacter pythonis]RMH93116.1 3-deoxy-D-manno-octulosonic acid transferase [Lysobacter pythonis]